MTKEELIKENENNLKALNFEATIKEQGETIKGLEKRICMEQESHKETEDELIKLRVELDTLRATGTTISDGSGTGKDEIIVNLQNSLLQEQQISAHLQFVQEREIIEKGSSQCRNI